MAPPRSGLHGRSGAVAAVLLASVGDSLLGRAAAQRGPEKPEPPKWLSDDAKEAFVSLHQEDDFFNDIACEYRDQLLTDMSGKGNKEVPAMRAQILLGISICEYRKGNFAQSKKRFLSTLAEFETLVGGGEDQMLKHPQLANVPLMKQAADFMSRHEVTQAGTALRRCREVTERSLKRILKQVHKQNKQEVPVQLWYDELSGYGKTGTYMPMLRQQFLPLKQDLSWLQVMDQSLDAVDARIVAIDKAQKAKRSLLDVSKGKKGGTLLYVRALFAEPIIDADRLVVAQELGKGTAKALTEEAASLDKPVTLLKRSKEGSGCQKDKGLGKTCSALQKVADVQSNGFGEARVIIVKPGKKQVIETCSTNANVGILVAAKDGAELSVSGSDAPTVLKAGQPVGFDFCREASLKADSATPVLFAQAWHPEFAAVERTTELRARSEAFGLSEEEVKAVTKVVNDHAKTQWEKAAKQWREGSPGIAEIKGALQSEVDEKVRQKEEAAAAKRKEDEASDEVRKKNMEELQKKRDAKAKAAAAKEEARQRREKIREQERALRDPWLNAPEVAAVEEKIASLKEQRRDANAQLEFDLSTQLTKDISAAERELKRTIKKAKKEYKKSGKVPEAAAAKDDTKATESAGGKEEKAEGGGEAAKLKKELEKVKADKEQASKDEDYKTAKKLKQKQQELEAKIAKLEL